MSNNKMLIDATHPEETRVVVLRDGRVEEFDYESAARKLLRGNIYLAKVTRVEPSLQAAFVDYGGNRHGFLAFNEIHPDYYQIPFADRQALLEEEAAAEAAEEAAADAHAERLARRRRNRGGGVAGRNGEARSSERSPSAAGDEIEDVGSVEEVEFDAEIETPNDDDTPSRVLAAESGEPHDVLSEDVSEPDVIGEFAPDLMGEDTRSDTRHAEPPSTEDTTDEEDADDGDVQGHAAEAPEAFTGEDESPVAEDDSAVPEDGVAARAPTPGGEVIEPEEGTNGNGEAEVVDETGSEDALEELPARPRRRPRSYKIQEVIKRRQVILVQVVKEERGNKGAALTTYLSLAGRYTVLMPNTARGGGISRKITNPQDRKRLKAIAAELDVPEGMGLIIRTAGAARTKQEIKRDFEYLLRLWESVRELTLQSTAPSLVYEEGDLIKRSIRDLYNKDVEEIVVAGEPAHREAKDFMRMLMPSHAKNVVLHQDAEPLFTRYGIERQLNAMFSPFVTLRSGGYLVINQTEALVAIDVNSGKSTREFSIEETALNTNIEAADEIARQLKLRDLAGLIVIDFIDMEEKRNNRAVERRLKEALRFDRARIQIGRISHFGLLEMSRQRLRTGVLEGSTSQCPHCQGTGIIRSTESVALAVLRGLEDALMVGTPTSLAATTTAQVALYILNNKRHFILDMEARHGISIAVQASEKLQGANFTIEKTHQRAEQPRRAERSVVNMDWGFEGEEDETIAASAVQETDAEGGGRREDRRQGQSPRYRDAAGVEVEGEDEGGGRSRRRRRRRGRRGGDRPNRGDAFEPAARGTPRAAEQGQMAAPVGDDDEEEFELDGVEASVEDQDEFDVPLGDDSATGRRPQAAGEGAEDHDDGEGRRRRRRRGRRGGRRGRGRDRGTTGTGVFGAGHVTEEFIDDFAGPVSPDDIDAQSDMMRVVEPTDSIASGEGGPEAEARSALLADESGPEPETAAATEAPREKVEGAPGPVTQAARVRDAEPDLPSAPPRRPRHEPTASEPRLERVVVSPDRAAAGLEGAEPAKPARKGWWQRRLDG